MSQFPSLLSDSPRVFERFAPGSTFYAFQAVATNKLSDAWTEVVKGETAARIETRRDGQHLILARLTGGKSPVTKETVAYRLSRSHS